MKIKYNLQKKQYTILAVFFGVLVVVPTIYASINCFQQMDWGGKKTTTFIGKAKETGIESPKKHLPNEYPEKSSHHTTSSAQNTEQKPQPSDENISPKEFSAPEHLTIEPNLVKNDATFSFAQEKQMQKTDKAFGKSVEKEVYSSDSDTSPAKSDLQKTRKSWYVIRNKLHKAPAPPADFIQGIRKFNAYYIGNTEQKVIYLTFDEGYELGHTKKILDTLASKGVQATFFITGSYLKSQPSLVKRMVQEGHLVGNHTVSHGKIHLLGKEALKKEIKDVDKSFTQLTGGKMTYFRPPYGEYSTYSLNEIQGMGYKTIFWSFAYDDYDVNNQKGEKYAFAKITENLHNGAILLLHAGSKDNAAVLGRIIDEIRNRGYTIALLDL